MTNGGSMHCSAVRRAVRGTLTQRDMDLAASIQSVTEEIVLRLTRSDCRKNRRENLCLAGGVALNCVANGKVLRDGRFERVWVQPAAGDAGGALGAALAAYHLLLWRAAAARLIRSMQCRGAILAQASRRMTSSSGLSAAGAVFETLGEAELLERRPPA